MHPTQQSSIIPTHQISQLDNKMHISSQKNSFHFFHLIKLHTSAVKNFIGWKFQFNNCFRHKIQPSYLMNIIHNFFNEDFWLMCHIEWTFNAFSSPSLVFLMNKKLLEFPAQFLFHIGRELSQWEWYAISIYLHYRLLYNLIFIFISCCAVTVPYYNMFVPLPWTLM